MTGVDTILGKNGNNPVKHKRERGSNAVDIAVGRRVRMRRLAVSMTQQCLGERLGVSFQQVQKYEKGTNRIGASRLQQIADALDAPVAFFFESAGANAMTIPASDMLDNVYALRLMKAFSSIKDRKQQRAIVTFVEDLASSVRS